jgi:hypothetical protein
MIAEQPPEHAGQEGAQPSLLAPRVVEGLLGDEPLEERLRELLRIVRWCQAFTSRREQQAGKAWECGVCAARPRCMRFHSTIFPGPV